MLTAIIMAGGSGERFWPLSTPEKPKQLLKIFSEKTMIRETVDRILPIIKPENIFIATNIIQAREIEKELSGKVRFYFESLKNIKVISIEMN